MQALEITIGPHASHALLLDPARAPSVGAGRTATYRLASDLFLAGLQFEIEPAGPARWLLRDCHSTNGTFLNGVRIESTPLHEGDTVAAGRSAFLLTSHPAPQNVLLQHPGPVPQSASAARVSEGFTLTGVHRRVCETIASHHAPVYAIVDAGRNLAAVRSLQASGARIQSLHEGRKAKELADVAPYLIEIGQDRVLLERLIPLCWGQACALFLFTPASFDQLRRHLRTLLIVETQKGRRLVFRFYDPRVARAMLPTYKSPELTAFFGPIQWIMAEAKDPLQFSSFSREPVGLCEPGALREEVANLSDDFARS